MPSLEEWTTVPYREDDNVTKALLRTLVTGNVPHLVKENSVQKIGKWFGRTKSQFSRKGKIRGRLLFSWRFVTKH